MDMKLLAKVLYCRESASADDIMKRSKDDNSWLKIYDLHHNGGLNQYQISEYMGVSQPFISVVLKEIRTALHKNRMRTHKIYGPFEAFPFRLWWDDMVDKGILVRSKNDKMIDIYYLNDIFNNSVINHITYERDEYKSLYSIIEIHYPITEETWLIYDIILARWDNPTWHNKHKELCDKHTKDENLRSWTCKECKKNGLEVEKHYSGFCVSCRNKIRESLIKWLEERGENDTDYSDFEVNSLRRFKEELQSKEAEEQWIQEEQAKVEAEAKAIKEEEADRKIKLERKKELEKELNE